MKRRLLRKRVGVALDGVSSACRPSGAAGLGIGTLYRHLPCREALVEAVYRDQIEELRAGAAALLANRPPIAGLRAWMDLFADWVDKKRGMVATLATMRGDGTLDLDASRR